MNLPTKITVARLILTFFILLILCIPFSYLGFNFPVYDFYGVTVQLNSIENEPIDSWAFFKYLKNNNVDCIYVCWKKHKLYDKYKSMYPENVIGLDEDGVKNYEFFSRIRFYRTKKFLFLYLDYMIF